MDTGEGGGESVSRKPLRKRLTPSSSSSQRVSCHEGAVRKEKVEVEVEVEVSEC